MTTEDIDFKAGISEELIGLLNAASNTAGDSWALNVIKRKRQLQRAKKTQSIQTDEFQKHKKDALQNLVHNQFFMWFVENVIMERAIFPRLGGADLDSTKRYNLIKAEVYDSLLDEILETLKEEKTNA